MCEHIKKSTLSSKLTGIVFIMGQNRNRQKCTLPEDENKVALPSGPWELSSASITNLYSTFGEREFTEPITVFGPNVAKAIGMFGELWVATVIL